MRRQVRSRAAGMLRALLLGLLLVLALGLAGGPSGPIGGAQAQDTAAVDLTAWEAIAAAAERMIAQGDGSDGDLRDLRATLADWRARLLAAQTANAARIDTLKAQLAALGPAPAEGATEAEEIAARRSELAAQLSALQAPAIAAQEAWRRADGLIGEIDRILRDRQAQALMALGPSPLNPLNWQAALEPLTAGLGAPIGEVRADLADPAARQAALSSLPVAVGFLLLAGALVLRGRGWMARLRLRIEARTPPRWRGILMAPASLGQVLVPGLGMIGASAAFGATRLGAEAVQALLVALPMAGLLLFTALWLADRCFPPPDSDAPHFPLPAEAQARARLLIGLTGWIIAADTMLQAILMLPEAQANPGAAAIVTYPLTVMGGLVLLKLGAILRRIVPPGPEDTGAEDPAAETLAAEEADSAEDEGAAAPPPVPARGDGTSLRDRLARGFGIGAQMGGLGGIVLGGLGYAEAGALLVGASILSLGLAGVVLVLQRLLARLALALAAQAGLPEARAGEGLLPVLTGLGLILGSLPLFALIWGAQPTDLAELWSRFLTGFRLGETRLAPADLVAFALVFGAIYSATRLVQAGLRTSVLPRTTLDPGGQTAIVAGVGYIGVFLAAVAGITAAGFDLSSLAIVAGALSVGIGFGLQNIVSNFVSGIILLIERPVSEGDWIEVGGVQGTVRSISVRSTRIETFDRSNVIVPNADLISNQVTNWTRFNRMGRLIVRVGVAYGTDTRKVDRVLREVARRQPGLQRYPEPMVIFAGFGASSLDFELRVILVDVNDSLRIRSALNHAIAERFVAEGIEIPFPQQDVWLRNPEALRPAPAPPHQEV